MSHSTILPDGKLETLPTAALLALQDAIGNASAEIARAKEALQDEFRRRFDPSLTSALDGIGKSTGSATFEVAPGIRCKGEAPVKVTWDQKALFAIAQTLPWASVNHLCKVEMTPREAAYKAMMPGTSMWHGFTAARTTQNQPRKFSLIMEG